MKHAPHDMPYDAEYLNWLNKMKLRVSKITTPLFTTAADNRALWNTYLAAIPTDHRQAYTCHCCMRFFELYANLCYIDPVNGSKRSVFWSTEESEDVNKKALARLDSAVKDAKIVGIFYTDTTQAGVAQQGGFDHIHAQLPRQVLKIDHAKIMAAKLEDVKNVRFALSTYPKAVCETALALLKSGQLVSAEAAIDQANFMLTAHALKGDANTVHILTAPAGFCHPRSSVLGNLIEQLISGMSTDDIKKIWAKTLDPLNYQRPTAPPKAGNLAQAEKIFADQKLADTLKRKFASFSELHKRDVLWTPPEAKPAEGGVFGHLATAEAVKLASNVPVKITFAKFLKTVLPEATTVKLQTGRHWFYPTTAATDSPPILQWDNWEDRNPVSWFTRAGGNNPVELGLDNRTAIPVCGLALQPFMFGDVDTKTHHGTNAFWLVYTPKIIDFYPALFPVYLKAELREISSVFEAHNNSAYGKTAAVKETAPAVGYTAVDSLVLVKVGNVETIYHIDRWD